MNTIHNIIDNIIDMPERIYTGSMGALGGLTAYATESVTSPILTIKTGTFEFINILNITLPIDEILKVLIYGAIGAAGGLIFREICKLIKHLYIKYITHGNTKSDSN